MENVPKPSSKAPASFMSPQPIPEHGISNRRPSMARKLERARVQAREAAAIEFTKLYYPSANCGRGFFRLMVSFGGFQASRCGNVVPDGLASHAQISTARG